MSEHNEVLEWIRLAEMDIATANHMWNTYHPKPLEIVCFHSQQAAEKIVKGYLVSKNIEPLKTHDMQVLIEMCIENNKNFSEIYDESVTLTNYAVRFRYPAEHDLIESDAEKAIANADKIMSFVKEQLNNCSEPTANT